MKKSVGSLLCASMLLSIGIGVAQPAILTIDSNIVSADVDNNVYDSGELVFKISDGSAIIMGISKTNTNPKNIVIPSTISDKNQTGLEFPVKSIGPDAFNDPLSTGKQITSLKFASPSNIETIQDDAFANNNLKEVQLPESLKEIGHGAFMGNSLTSLTLPSNLEKLDMYAFTGNQIIEISNLKESFFQDHNTLGFGDQWIGGMVSDSSESQSITLGTELNLGNGIIRVTKAEIDGLGVSVTNNTITIGKDDRKLEVVYQYLVDDHIIATYHQSAFFPQHGKYQIIKDMLDSTQQKLKTNKYDFLAEHNAEMYISAIKDYFNGSDLSRIQYQLPNNPQLSSEQDLIDNFQKIIDQLVPLKPDTNSGSNSRSGTGSNSNSGTSTPSVNPTVKDFEGILQVTAPNGTTIYKDADLSNKTDRILNKDSRWRVFGVKKVEGNTLAYNLGGNQWVKADDVLITAEQGLTQDKMTPMLGTFVVKVPNKPTWSTVVWREDLSTTTKYLKPRTSWKVFGKKLIKGKIYYNLGGNQWASSEYGFLK